MIRMLQTSVGYATFEKEILVRILYLSALAGALLWKNKPFLPDWLGLTVAKENAVSSLRSLPRNIHLSSSFVQW